MEEAVSKKRKSNIFRLLKIVLIFFLGLILLVIVGTLILYLKKDDIGRDLLMTVNTQTNGELEFEDVNVAPFARFPDVSLTLIKPKYFEVPAEKRDSIHQPILSFTKIIISLDILKLIRSQIDISGIQINNGRINLIEYEDSTFNFQKAFRTPENKEKQIEKVKGSMYNLDDLLLSVDLISLRNITLDITRKPANSHQNFTLIKSRASLKILPDSIRAKVDIDVNINQYSITEKITLEDESFSWIGDLAYYNERKQLKIYQSEVGLGKAVFDLLGDFQLDDKGYADLQFEANDESMRFTKLILTSEGIDNLNSGELYFNGNVSGPLWHNFPEFELNFGIRDMSISIPNSTKSIENLQMRGYFNSGKKMDLSLASFRLDTLTGLMPEGHIHASLGIENFVNPKLSYIADIQTSLEGLDMVFDIYPFEDINGIINLKNDYKGYLDDAQGWIDLKEEKMSLELDSVSFNIVDVMDVRVLDGAISGGLDSIHIEDLYLETGNSDLRAKGEVHNITNLVIDRGIPVEANIVMQSKVYDFEEFWTFLPDVAKSFPFAIKDAKLDVYFSSSYKKLTEFTDVPEMDFKIRLLEGSVQDLLPWTELKDGHFRMSERDSVAILDFQNFNLEVVKGKMAVDFQYYITQGEDDSLGIALAFENLNPSNIIQGVELDSLPDFLNAKFDGSLKGKLAFAADSLKQIEILDLFVDEFLYISQPDSIYLKSFALKSRDIYFDQQSVTNFFRTLACSNIVHAEKYKSPLLQMDNLSFTLEAKSGEFTIIPHDSQQYGKEEMGQLVIRPFETPPAYHLMFNVKEFPINDFMSSFYSEEILTGKVDMDLDLEFYGEDVESITSNMNGSINVNGKQLALHGIDLDEFINNFKRSQQFNLLDIGAVALAGPAGILFSKGSDYAVLLASKSGEKTTISQFASIWNVKDGRITIDDVAFATFENRIALKGWVDMRYDSLDVTVAIVDKNGCSLINQNIYGKSVDLQYSKVKVIKTLLAPVAKLLRNITATDCEKFYIGLVEHPSAETSEN